MAIILLLSFSIYGCDDGNIGEFDAGTSGGSGDIVFFSFDCDSPEVYCPGAEKVGRQFGSNSYENKCAWSCALNNTDFKDYRYKELSEPARHIFNFRKIGDSCWEVVSVSTDKCGKDIKKLQSY